jgi:hypothetical protein
MSISTFRFIKYSDAPMAWAWALGYGHKKYMTRLDEPAVVSSLTATKIKEALINAGYTARLEIVPQRFAMKDFELLSYYVVITFDDIADEAEFISRACPEGLELDIDWS